MRITFIALLILPFFLHSQDNQPYFAARAQTTEAPTDLGGDLYRMTLIITDETAVYDGLDIMDDSTYFYISPSTVMGEDINIFPIINIVSAFAGQVEVDVRDIASAGQPQQGSNVICQASPQAMFSYVSGAGDPINQAISDYNLKEVEGIANRVWAIASSFDTSTIVIPIEGDVAYISTDSIWFRDSLAWLFFSGGGSGGGSTEVADGLTILGDGSGGDPFRADTALLVTATTLGDTAAAIRGDFPEGTVTSVGLSLPSQFTISGSPVTTSGTLTGSWNSQAANTVLAGPVSGGAASPTFRSLVAADITAGGGVTGSGTANVFPMWTGTNTIGNSSLSYTATSGGILGWSGQVFRMNGSNIVVWKTGSRFDVGSAAITSLDLSASGGYGARIESQKMRVGDNTTPTYTLEVNGPAKYLPISAPVNSAGVWYTSSGNYPHYMDGTVDWALVRGAAESFTAGSVLFAGTSGQAQQNNSNLFWDNSLIRLSIGNNSPQRTLHVTGEVRITDLTTDTPTRIVGADADGDLGEMTAGTGISFAGGQVSSTVDLADIGTNLSADDVPVWDGAEFQPSLITTDGFGTIYLTEDFPFLGLWNGAPGAANDGYVLVYSDADGGILLANPPFLPLDMAEDKEVLVNGNTLYINSSSSTGVTIDDASEILILGLYPDMPSGVAVQMIFDNSDNSSTWGQTSGESFFEIPAIGGARINSNSIGVRAEWDESNPLVTFYDDEIFMPNIADASAVQPYNIVMTSDGELRKDTVYAPVYGYLYGAPLDSIDVGGVTDQKSVTGWTDGGYNSGHWTYTDSSMVYSATAPTHRCEIALDAKLIGGASGDVELRIGYSTTAGSGTIVLPADQQRRITLSGGSTRQEFHSSCIIQVAPGYEIKVRGARGDFGIREARLSTRQID